MSGASVAVVATHLEGARDSRQIGALVSPALNLFWLVPGHYGHEVLELELNVTSDH